MSRFAGYRHPQCLRADVAETLLEVFGQPAPLLAGVREAGDAIAVLPVLYHLLWRYDLCADPIAMTRLTQIP